MSVPRLTVENLTKSFYGVRVLDNVHFLAHAGETLGLVGENGAGKSTAMNVLAGIVRPDSGHMVLEGAPYAPHGPRDAEAAGVSFIQQELSIFSNLTVVENLFLGRYPRIAARVPLVSWRRAAVRAREVLQLLDLDVSLRLPAERLSPGERQLLEIARGLAAEARIVIFDEPTTSLTRPEAARLFDIIGRLKARGATILFISHVLEDVLRLCNRIIVMRDGKIAGERTQPSITAEGLVRTMVGRSIESLFPKRTGPAADALALLEVQDVGEQGVLEDNTFTIRRGEIVGLGGLMGSGRTQLARVLFGLDPHHEGTIRISGRPLRSGDVGERLDAGVAFMTEDRRREGLLMDESVAGNSGLAALPLYARNIATLDRARLERAVREVAERLQLKSGPLGSTPVRALSGGNQQKVVLGRWLLRNPTLFILDEPTRGVDMGAREEIYRILAELTAGGMGVLLISSELEELMGLCDRILIMCRGRLRGEFPRVNFDREQMLKCAFGQDQAV